MEFINSKETKFNDLLEEYRKLKESTHIEAQIVRPGQPYKVHHIIPEEIIRQKDIAKELIKNFKEHFKENPEELYEIMRDAE